MIIAPTIIAMVALPGMPRVRSGMKLHWAVALFAASGAATPFMAPRPISEAWQETFFSIE